MYNVVYLPNIGVAWLLRCYSCGFRVVGLIFQAVYMFGDDRWRRKVSVCSMIDGIFGLDSNGGERWNREVCVCVLIEFGCCIFIFFCN